MYAFAFTRVYENVRDAETSWNPFILYVNKREIADSVVRI